MNTSSQTLNLTRIIEKIRLFVDENKEKFPTDEHYRLTRNCAVNTLQTSTEIIDEEDVYIFTGDIPALWLRDSCCQVKFLFFLINEIPEIKLLIRGLLLRLYKCILVDPYANAFNKDYTIWERKYELDSLSFPIELLYLYYKYTGDESIFKKSVIYDGLKKILEVALIEQHHNEKSKYTFDAHWEIIKNKSSYTGMIWQAFRPSDDPCKYHYNIPAQFFFLKCLEYMETFFVLYEEKNTLSKIKKMADEIKKGIYKFGILKDNNGNKYFAYEVDGLGNFYFMDDANLPNLLGLPYLKCLNVKDAIYQNTRKKILSSENKFFIKGKFATGIGSPHAIKNGIWHLGLITQAFTATLESEQEELEKMILDTHDNTYFLHESFDPDNPSEYTRPWFCWVNSFFAEYVFSKYIFKKHL